MNFFLILVLGALIGAAIMYLICRKTTSVELPNALPPKGLITPSQAKTLDVAFNSRHQLISDEIVKRPDNRSSWYSLSDLRGYLNYAEKQAQDLNYTMDGVRLYLGAHPDISGVVGYTTVFFVPTGSKNLSQTEALGVEQLQKGNGDIPGGDGLDMGTPGDPPQANYPQ